MRLLKTLSVICVFIAIAFVSSMTIEVKMGPSGMLRADVEARIEEGADDQNPMENYNLREGDILEDDDQEDVLLLYNAMTTDNKRWPLGKVPYVIDNALSDKTPLIEQAMRHIEGKTCIRFIKRTNEQSYVNIFAGKGCYSYIGSDGVKARPLSLGKGCDRFGTVVHELTHSLGFFHEHTRSDRDRFIKIFYDNIGDQFHSEFKPKSAADNRLYTNFDYDSIMLYGSKSFTVDKKKPSMLKLNGGELTEVHHKKGLTDRDAQRINKLYQC